MNLAAGIPLDLANRWALAYEPARPRGRDVRLERRLSWICKAFWARFGRVPHAWEEDELREKLRANRAYLPVWCPASAGGEVVRDALGQELDPITRARLTA